MTEPELIKSIRSVVSHIETVLKPNERSIADDWIVSTASAAADALERYQWRGMASAPKDGREILIIAVGAYSPKARVGWYQNDGFYFLSRSEKFHGGGVTKMVSVTNWMPLPPVYKESE